MILNKGYIIYVYPEGVVQLSHPCDVYWRKRNPQADLSSW